MARTIGGNQAQPGNGLSENSGRRHGLADDLTQQFGLDTPGVGMALLQINRMRGWGVAVTPAIAKACIAHFVGLHQQHEHMLAGQHLPERTQLVYYMKTGDRVKIGFTTNLSERLSALMPEQLLAVERGDPKLERARHRQFAALRTRGEWFRYEEPLVQHIATLADMTRPDDLLDTATAAVAFGVQPTTIRKWVSRGKLQPTARGKHNKSLYRRAELEDLHSRMLDG